MTPQEQPQHECRCEFCKERLCNGECVFGLRINPPQPSKEGEVREKIRKIMVEDKLEGATIGKTETALLNLFQSLLKEERESGQIRRRNTYLFFAATIYRLNNPNSRMCIPNVVFSALDKKLKSLPGDREITESEALQLVTSSLTHDTTQE